VNGYRVGNNGFQINGRRADEGRLDDGTPVEPQVARTARAVHLRTGGIRRIRMRCRDTQVPFFFKQWGGWDKKKAGRTPEV